MAEDDNNPETRDPSAASRARRRRAVKPQTIDLQAEATDEMNEAGSPDHSAEEQELPAGAAGSAPEETSESPDDGQAPPDDTGEEARDVEMIDESRPEADPTSPQSRAESSRLPGFIIAAFIGAVAAVALFLTLQFSEILPGYRQPETGLQAQLQETSQALDAFDSRIAALEETSGATAEGLGDRVEALERDVQQAGSAAPDLSPVEERIAALESRTSEIEAAIGELSTGGENAQTEQRIAGLEQAIAEQRDALQSLREELAGELGSIRGAMQDADQAVDRNLARAAAGAIALSSLMRAVDDGEAYAAELAALRPLVAQDTELRALSAHAESGLPTQASLTEGFESAADNILRAGNAQGADDGVVARLAASARSLVSIRPSTPVEGDSRPAVLSRIEAALGRGDLRSALREWQSLDEAARTASSEWAEALEARVAAETELAEIAAATSAALGSVSANGN